MKRINNENEECWEGILRQDDLEISQKLESRLDTLIRKKSAPSKSFPVFGMAWASSLAAVLAIILSGWFFLVSEGPEKGAPEVQNQVAHSRPGASPLPEELFGFYDLLSGADEVLFSPEDEWIFQEWILN